MLSGIVPLAASAAAPEGGRQVEEIVVTAEKLESTVSDMSISITAFSETMIQDMGIQSAEEMINYIPATTRDAYDIRIRDLDEVPDRTSYSFGDF